MKVEPGIGRSVATGESPALDYSSRRTNSLARHSIRIAFVVLAIGTSFWRVLFLGETLIDVNTLNNQLPWGYSAGHSDYAYNRRDLTDTYVTREYFVASAYRDGEFPLWNPYTMAGHPIYADGVTRTLSPFLLFYRFFDVPLGYSLARITELMLAAILMYIFLAVIGASGGGALMGSLVFAFSAHSMLHLTGLGWWGGLMWLPLILLFVDRAIRRKSYLNSLLAGLCLAAQFFCGYLPNQIYYTGAVVFYYLFFAYVKRGADGKTRRVTSALAMIAVTLGAGFAISATQWAPAIELLSHSNRKVVGGELGFIWLPPWYAATLVFPNLFGEAYDASILRLFTAIGVSHDHILYVGAAALVPLAFVLYWLKLTRRNRAAKSLIQSASASFPLRDHCVLFAVLGACSLFMMMAAPLYIPLTRYVPILQVIRVPVRAGVLFLFAAAALVAFGTDLLLRSDGEHLRRFVKTAKRLVLWMAALVALAAIAACSMRLAGFTVREDERGKLAFIGKSLLALGAQFAPPNLGVAIPLSLLFLVILLVWAFWSGRITARVLIGALVLMLVVDLFWIGAQFNRSFDRSRVFPKTDITDRLQSLPQGRVLVVPSDLESNRRVTETSPRKIIAPPNTLLPYQIPTVTGKNQQFPKWYREFASLIEPQPNLSHVVFDEYRSRYFDLLNVRYVMTHDSVELAEYEHLTSAEGIALYENKKALPRAFFVSRVIDASSHEEAISHLSSASFEPATVAVIENAGPALGELRQRPDDFAAAVNQPSSGEARISEYKRNRVVIETDNHNAEALVLSDNYYPGWQAYIDDAPAEIFRANCTMRAVAIPAGRHLVSFVFAPRSFFVSLYVSIAAAGLTLFALIPLAAKRRRENSHDIRQDNQDS